MTGKSHGNLGRFGSICMYINPDVCFYSMIFLVIEAAAAALTQPAEAVSQLWPQQFNAATSLHVAHAAASLADDGIIRIANALSLQSSVKLLEHVNSALPEALAASADTAAFEVDDVYVSYFGDVLRRDSEDGIRRRHDLKLAISRPPVADAVDELLATLGPTIAECLGPDAVLHECAALISDPQAPQQPFHPDTPYRSEQGLAVLTAFICSRSTSPWVRPSLYRSRTRPPHTRPSTRPRPSSPCCSAGPRGAVSSTQARRRSSTRV